jgi:uncharacterized membrane protein YhfC
MEYHIPIENIFALILASILVAIIFAGLIIFAKKNLINIDNFALFAGMFVWFAAVQIESIFHHFLLRYFDSKIYIYAIYGGIMAGLFEETGRLLCFLKKLKPTEFHKNNSLYYGIGHGGFEAFYLISFSNIIKVFICIYINNGKLSEYLKKDEKSLSDLEKQLLETMKVIYSNFYKSKFFDICFMVVWERISAIIFHISASVVVWYAASDFRKNSFLYYIAIGMHFFFDFLSVIFSYYVVKGNIFITEIFIFCMAIGCAFIGYKCWKYFENNIEIKQNLIIESIESIESINTYNNENQENQ